MWAHFPTEERLVIEPTPGVLTRQLCNFKFSVFSLNTVLHF